MTGRFWAAVLVCAGWTAAEAAVRPAGTVTFADLQTIAAQVASLGKGTADPVLTRATPAAIRNQGVAKLFGPMRKGAPGVAVCYVDEQAVARLMATAGKQGAGVSKTRAREFERAKYWSVLYPVTTTRAAFVAKLAKQAKDGQVRTEKNGAVAVPPGGHSRRTLFAYFTPDGQWAALAPSPSLAAHTPTAAAAALRRPLGNNLAFIHMDTAGARAMFHSDAFAGGDITVRLTAAGLEIQGAVRTAIKALPPLPPDALTFAGVPRNAPLFGMTSLPDDLRSTDVFTLLGADLGAYIRQSSVFKLSPGANAYWIPGDATVPQQDLRARLLKILPEAAAARPANVMFCSPTTVLRINLPLYAKKCLPAESVQMHAALRMLRRVRGEGMGFMGWRTGNTDHFFIRVSRDELWGTANLWSTLFL